MLVAQIEEEVVGSGYIQIRKAEGYEKHDFYGHMGCMYVKPKHHRKGVIQQVQEGLIDWAKSKQIKEVRMDVYEENAPAIAADEKAGFQ